MKVLVEYTRTEIVRERLWVEADSEQEAVELTEEYEIDTTDSYEVDSIRWEISEVTAIESEDSTENGISA